MQLGVYPGGLHHEDGFFPEKTTFHLINVESGAALWSYDGSERLTMYEY